MIVIAIKTKIIQPDESLIEVIKDSIDSIEEGSVLAVASKILALSQGRYVPADGEKSELITKYADKYLDPTKNQYGVTLTITNNTLIGSAGIDGSNADGIYILWPENVQQAANDLWQELKTQFQLENFGLVITDSASMILRRGTKGICLAHAGFAGLNNYIGDKDVFGDELKVSIANLTEGLATAAVLEMGEGNEQTPLALISDVKNLTFNDQPPTEAELKELYPTFDNDLYQQLLKKADWID